VVTNQCRVDSLRVLSPDHGTRMEWDSSWSASVTGKARGGRRPRGAGGERWLCWLRRRGDIVNSLPLAAPEEMKQQALEATETSYITGRGGEASSPRSDSGARRRRRFQEEK
jgi:hypothetical protein